MHRQVSCFRFHLILLALSRQGTVGICRYDIIYLEFRLHEFPVSKSLCHGAFGAWLEGNRCLYI